MAYIGFDIENRLHNTAFTFDSYTSDGVTSIYALSVPKPLTSRAILVSFDGLTQQPELDYTLDGESNLKIINVPVIHTQMQILHLTRPVQLHTIPDKSISSSKFVGDLQTPGDLVVGGKLTILGSGEEEVSTVFPALSVQASTILINADESGSGVAVGSAGITIDRGQLPDKSFVWDDTVDKWSTEGETLLATVDGSATLNVLKAGDTMTGELTLSGDPTGEDSAATKSYVDRQALVSSLLF
tara:strand:- start:1048 stop:1773 length:726 start_codon:yes stop_codon:yes gene_type:complete